MLEYRTVDGDEDKFREDWWMREGWAGGLERFSLEKKTPGDWLLQMDGRVIVPEDDYEFNLKVGKDDLGFFRARYSEYRKYFDDTGGFFPLFSPSSFDLDGDPHLNIGDFLLEAGMTLPDLPQVVVGYEHRFKEGEKSLLEWGGVTGGMFTRNIFPSFKEMDEELDIVRVEVTHTVSKVTIYDRLHYEKFQTETRRFEETRDLGAGSSGAVEVSENYEHDALINTLHLESRLTDTVYLSLGWLLNDLKGEGSFNMMTVPFGPEPFDKNWQADSIELKQESHVLNLNAMLGPYRDIRIQGGIQADFTETEGTTDAVLTETLPGVGPVSPEARIISSMDEDGLEETFGIRYSGIPHTSLFAEGRWTQKGIDLFEREMEENAVAFERLTDTDVDRSRYTFGFSTSPIRRLTFSGHYRRRNRESDYDHIVDTEPGYSAFINAQELKTDEIEAKLTARVTSAVKASLQYQFVETEIDSFFQTDPPAAVKSGDYTADIYSLGVTATPLARLYLTGLFSYRNIESESFDNGVPAVGAYEADIYTFIGTAGWAAGEKTDLKLQYIYSRSDNFNGNPDEGLVLGSDGTRHGLSLDCSHRLTEKMKARFRYGFFKNNGEEGGGADDYDAHVVGVGLEYNF
ncbi:MAG: hypothetical protein R6V25_13150 [Desulfatiglandales bacterium]